MNINLYKTLKDAPCFPHLKRGVGGEVKPLIIKQMKTIKQLQFLFLAVLVLVSCTDDIEIVPLGAYENGFFVVNEGPFGQDKGEISFVSYNLQTVKQDVFKSENNGEILGDVLQSIFMFGDKAFLIVNGSNKIEVVNRFTFKRIATINTGLNNPRHMTVLNGKGYVTNWGIRTNPDDDFVAIVNLSNFTVEASISVVDGAEKIIAYNNNLYIAHKGANSSNNMISIINSINNTISNTITTGDRPADFVIANNQLYVFCSGKTVYDDNWNIIEQTAGVFKTYNLTNFDETQSISFSGVQQPSYFSVYQNKVYYVLNGQVYAKELSSNHLPTNSLFDPNIAGYGLYGLNVFNDRIYVCDAKNFSQNGNLKIFNLNGNLQAEFPTRIGPNGVVFN